MKIPVTPVGDKVVTDIPNRAGLLLTFPVEGSPKSWLQVSENKGALPHPHPPSSPISPAAWGSAAPGEEALRRRENSSPVLPRGSVAGGSVPRPSPLKPTSPRAAQEPSREEKAPSLPKAASLLSAVGGAGAPRSVPSGSFPRPLVQRLNAEGSHMVLCGHIFPSTASSRGECRAPRPVSAGPPLPRSQPRAWRVVGSLSVTPPHTHTHSHRKLLK